jgi:hypothetical protein
MTEKLQAVAGREVVALLGARSTLKRHLRAEGAFQWHRRPGAGMERTGDEFPEWRKVLKRRAVRVVIMRGRIVQVGGQPQRVAHPGMLYERKQLGDLEPAPARAVGVFDTGRVDHVAERGIGGDHLPGRLRLRQFTLEPGELLGPEQIIVGPESAVGVRPVGAAIAAQVEHENVEQRPVRDFAIDPAGRPWSCGSAGIRGMRGGRGRQTPAHCSRRAAPAASPRRATRSPSPRDCPKAPMSAPRR